MAKKKIATPVEECKECECDPCLCGETEILDRTGNTEAAPGIKTKAISLPGLSEQEMAEYKPIYLVVRLTPEMAEFTRRLWKHYEGELVPSRLATVHSWETGLEAFIADMAGITK